MRVGKHTIFMIKFIMDFINGEMSDEEFRMEIANAFNEWLGEKRPNLI